jgi:hypothetical protein
MCTETYMLLPRACRPLRAWENKPRRCWMHKLHPHPATLAPAASASARCTQFVPLHARAVGRPMYWAPGIRNAPYFVGGQLMVVKVRSKVAHLSSQARMSCCTLVIVLVSINSSQGRSCAVMLAGCCLSLQTGALMCALSLVTVQSPTAHHAIHHRQAASLMCWCIVSGHLLSTHHFTRTACDCVAGCVTTAAASDITQL